MTAQAPDRLTNECSQVDLKDLKLFHVLTGDITKNFGRGEPYVFKNRPSQPPGMMSSMWRGHISCYRLTAGGTLQLEGFEYPPLLKLARENILETMEGDFWLLLSQTFGGARTYVPFRDGKVVADQSQWVRESRPNNSLERTRDR